MALTMQDLEKEIARLKSELAAKPAPVAGRPVARVVKLNSSGGLFVRDPSFVAFSESKGKKYTACANIPAEVARVLFTDQELLKEVCAFVAANMAA